MRNPFRAWTTLEWMLLVAALTLFLTFVYLGVTGQMGTLLPSRAPSL